MHKMGIMHRDIKPANILMVSKDPANFEIKLTDFGFSTFFDLKIGRKDICGSPMYMAPEIIMKKPYNHKSDIWSVGMMTFLLLSSMDVRPYPNVRNMSDLEKIVQAMVKNKDSVKSYQIEKFFKKKPSSKCIDFLHKALIIDVDQRMSAKQLLNHSWIRMHNEDSVEREDSCSVE